MTAIPETLAKILDSAGVEPWHVVTALISVIALVVTGVTVPIVRSMTKHLSSSQKLVADALHELRDSVDVSRQALDTMRANQLAEDRVHERLITAQTDLASRLTNVAVVLERLLSGQESMIETLELLKQKAKP